MAVGMDAAMAMAMGVADMAEVAVDNNSNNEGGANTNGGGNQNINESKSSRQVGQSDQPQLPAN